MEEEKYQVFAVTLWRDNYGEQEFYAVGAKSLEDLREHLSNIEEFVECWRAYDPHMTFEEYANPETYCIEIKMMENFYTTIPYKPFWVGIATD